MSYYNLINISQIKVPLNGFSASFLVTAPLGLMDNSSDLWGESCRCEEQEEMPRCLLFRPLLGHAPPLTPIYAGSGRLLGCKHLSPDCFLGMQM
jgi:hypothetical protein